MEEELIPPDEEEGEEDEDLDDIVPATDEEAAAKFEQHFYKVVNEVEDDPLQKKFLEHYTQLYNYMRSTRERSGEIDGARNELVDALTFNEERLREGLKLIEGDANQIEDLQGEISTSTQLIAKAQAREQAAQEVIDSLRKTIANLNTDIDVKNKMAQAELEENPAAAKHRETLEREKTKLISEMSKLSEKLNNALAYQEELERRTSLTDMRINDISTQLEETQVEVEKFKRNKQKIESDIVDYSDEVDKKSAEVQVLRGQMRLNQKMIAKYEMQLKEQTLAVQKCVKELDMWHYRINRVQNDYTALNAQADALRQENNATIKALREKAEQKIRMQIEVIKLVKEREQVDRRARVVEVDKMNMVDDNNKLKDVTVSMKRDLETQKIELTHNKELIEEHIKERDILNRNLLRQQAVGRDHVKVIKMQEQAKKHLDHEIDAHVMDIRKQGKQIFYLEKERDRLMEEALEKTKGMEDTIEEIRSQNQYLEHLKMVLASNDAKYKTKQSLLDTVRAERNALQKQIQQFNAESNDMKDKLKINHRQSEQLKESIGAKEVEIIKAETIKRKVMKEKENIKIELNNSLDWVRVLKKEISETTTEEQRLMKVIEDSDHCIKDQAKMITSLVTERDVLGSQLVRRNDEICLVEEKISLLLTTLHVGEAQYEARLDDIRLLKVEIKRLRQEGFLLKRTIINMDNFKVILFHIERELAKERMKTKALEEELHNPMNVHRWRRLSGIDPEMWELLEKTSKLQRRLLTQATAQIEVEKDLKEAENLYMNLRILISQQPGPQVQEELNKTQKSLFENTVRNKCLISEVNMLEVNNRHCTKNLARALTQLKDVKLQLKHEKQMHSNEKKVMMEGKILIEQLKGAVEMPPLKDKGDVVGAMSVSAMEITNRRY